MKVTSERHNGQVVLTVEVEPGRVEQAKEQASRRLASRQLIPGFRKGKAPRAMVERYYGPAALLDEAMRELLPKVFDEVVKEQQLHPIADPEVTITGYEPVTFQAVVNVQPTVVLGDYQTIRVTADPTIVTPEQVDEAIEGLRTQHATWTPVERPVEFGDSVTLDLKGTRDSEPFIEEVDVPYSVIAENQSPVPGFAGALVGAEIDQPKEIDLAFPADFEDERLAGKSYRFTAAVREIKARQLPDLDDAFAQSLSEGIETAEQLRQRVETNLRAHAEAEARSRAEERAVDQLVAISQVEFPPILIDRRVQQEIERQTRELKQHGITLDQWLKLAGSTAEQFREDLKEPTRAALARDLVLTELANAEGLAATTEETADLMRRVMRNASSDELAEMLATDQVRSAFAEMVRQEKAVRRLVESATEGQITFPQLAEQPVESDAAEAAPEQPDGVAAGQPGEATAVSASDEQPTALEEAERARQVSED